MLNLSGRRFGRLSVVRRVPGGVWLCQCDCGKISFVITGNLKKGTTRSCGCAWREAITSHGLSDSPEYLVWKAMHHRCRSNRPSMRRVYKDRGIKVCVEWSDFAVFLQDMGPRPKKHFQLDRIDNDKGYSKDNCRWISARQNLNNKRTCRSIEFDGKRQTIADWARELGVHYRTLNNRINRGWSVGKAFGKNPIE